MPPSHQGLRYTLHVIGLSACAIWTCKSRTKGHRNFKFGGNMYSLCRALAAVVKLWL